MWFQDAHIKGTHDDKVLVIGGHKSSTSTYSDNINMFILTVNHNTNKITNIRKLQSTLLLPNIVSTSPQVKYAIYKKSSGDFFIWIISGSSTQLHKLMLD